MCYISSFAHVFVLFLTIFLHILHKLLKTQMCNLIALNFRTNEERINIKMDSCTKFVINLINTHSVMSNDLCKKKD